MMIGRELDRLFSGTDKLGTDFRRISGRTFLTAGKDFLDEFLITKNRKLIVKF